MLTLHRWLDILRLRLRSFFNRNNQEAELDRELRAHLDLLVDENVARGMSAADARNAALRTFGNLDVTKEESRHAPCSDPGKSPARPAVLSPRPKRFAVLLVAAKTSIALGASGNIAVFSLARELLFTTPDVRDPASLVKFRVSNSSHATYERWRDLDACGAIGRIAGFSFEEQLNWFNGDANSVT